MTRAVRARLATIAGELRAGTITRSLAAAGIDAAIGPAAPMGRPRSEVTREQCVAALAEAGSTRAAARLLTRRGIACSEPLLRKRIAGPPAPPPAAPARLTIANNALAAALRDAATKMDRRSWEYVESAPLHSAAYAEAAAELHRLAVSVP